MTTAAPDPPGSDVRRAVAAEVDPARLRRYVLGLVSLAALAVSLTVLAGAGEGLPRPSLWLVAALWSVTVLAEARGIVLPLPEGQEQVSLIEVVLVPVMILLPPTYAIAVASSANLVAQVAVGRPPTKVAFNAAWQVLGVTLGTVVFSAVAGISSFEATGSHVLVALAAGGLVVTVNAIAFTGLVMILGGLGWRAAAREVVPTSLFDAGLAASGVLVAVLAVAAPVALPLLLVPISMDVLRTRVRAQTHELRASKERAEAANAAKSRFLSRMSHELRTPLNVILGYGQLLELEDRLPDDAREPVAAIVRSGRHLLTLIDEVLDISRIEAGRLVLHPAPVPLTDTVDECIRAVRPLAAARAITLTVVGDLDELHVTADRQRLVQVLLNLLTNAISYDREGGHVTLAGRRAHGGVAIAVSDTGPGIAADEIERLFVPFERLPSAEGTTGTGLGLSIVAQLVEAMGGQLHVDSERGHGATFTVVLPEADRDGD